MDPVIGIIVLNFKNAIDTIECVESLKQIDYKNYFVVIVDNNSQDGSFEELIKKYPEFDVLETGVNRGYAAGNNYGINYALNKGADYICILNNDVVVNPDFLGNLVKYMEMHSEIGIVGGNICEYYNRLVVQSTGFKINFYTARTPFINGGKSLSSIINQKPVNSNIINLRKS